MMENGNDFEAIDNGSSKMEETNQESIDTNISANSGDEIVGYDPNARYRQAQRAQQVQQAKNASTDRKMGETALRAADTYFTGGSVGAAVDTAEKIPVVGGAVTDAKNQLFDAAGKPIGAAVDAVDGATGGAVPLRDMANQANDAGAFDMANQAMGTMGGGAKAAGSGGTPGGVDTSSAASNSAGMQMPSNPSSGTPNMDLDLPEGAELDDVELPEQPSEPEHDDKPEDSDGQINPMTIQPWQIYLAIGAIMGFFILAAVIAIVGPNAGGVLDLTSGGSGNNITENINTQGTNMYSIEQIEAMMIYVGDSRTVNLNIAVGNPDLKVIAQVGAGYNWLVNEGRNQLELLLAEGNYKFVVLSLGVNDLHNVDLYINLYNSLISNHENITFYIQSVNPVDDEVASASGYTVTNAQIEVFNNKIKAAFPDNFIDSYRLMLSVFQSDDGVHYDLPSYRSSHNIVTNQIRSDNQYSTTLENYPTSAESTLLTGKSLVSVIGEAGISELESYIAAQIAAGGRCTGAGVAGAAVGLIYGLHQKGYHLPYYWSGGHGTNDGINPNWGSLTTPKTRTSGVVDKYSGLDCSGFVSWARNTAGVSGTATASGHLSLGLAITFEQAAAGDVLANSGHVILIVENKGSYLQVAESTPGHGVHFTTFDRDQIQRSKYTIVSMESYYRDNCR